jgi:hypothetical protein
MSTNTHRAFGVGIAGPIIEEIPTPALVAERELAEAGITVEQMHTTTGFGIRHGMQSLPNDTILNKYAAGALTLTGVMATLFGVDSPQHHQGHNRDGAS